MQYRSEFEKTIGYADNVVERMRDNLNPAYPKTYELWYAYVTGANIKLSQAIEETIERYGRISPGQIVHLHETYLSARDSDEQIENISSQITAEATALEKVIQKSFGTGQAFDHALQQAADDLKLDLDQDGLRTLIKRMAMETANTQRLNAEIMEDLRAAHQGIEVLKDSLEEMREESIMDQLTMIGNRRHFDRNMKAMFAEHQLAQKPMCLILADIDHFKKFNDKWGHQTGDQVLRLVAMAVKNNVKESDVACRYGGEEFAILVPNTTIQQAYMVAERVRKTVAKREVVKRSSGENLGRITVSLGIAQLKPSDTKESLIHRADLCLYAAKNAGRNQTITERDKVMTKAA